MELGELEVEEKETGAGPEADRKGQGAGGPAGGGGASEDGGAAFGAKEEQGGTGAASSQQGQGGGQNAGDGDAASRQQPPEVRLYMERKGFFSLRDILHGMTLLHCASEDCNANVVASLCQLAPDLVNQPAAGPKCVKMTALHIASQGTKPDLREQRLQIIRDLVAAKANLEAKKERGMTPFLVAAATVNTQGLELLYRLKANPNAENSEQCTALNLAWANKNCQQLLGRMGVRKGAGQPGSGRLG